MIFTALWTILAVVYLMVSARFLPSASHPIVRVSIDGLTMLFWFAGFIALAVYASAVGTFDDLYDGDLGYTDGAWNHYHGVLSAASAFGAFEW